MTMYQLVLRDFQSVLLAQGMPRMSVQTANSSVNLGLTKVNYLVKTYNTTESN